MKVSLNWLKEYVDIDVSTEELIDRMGKQLGAIEEVTDLGPKYDKAVVVKVISCEPHKDSDHMHVCLIDDGGVVKEAPRSDNGQVQVVCGAPNVAAGQTVIWLPPGATVPATFHDNEPFILGARELRGEMSNGMLASSKELDLSDDHSGIVVLEEDIAPGTSLHDALDLNDTIIELENKMFTHRPDCFGILGVAREIAGILGKPFKSPDWYKTAKDFSACSGLPLQIKVEDQHGVPRLTAIALSDVTVKASPLKMQSQLMRVGMRPINNIVDISNWVMHLTAQPTHAFDYDKVRAIDGAETATLVARQARQGETLALLNGKSVELAEGTLVIASALKPLALAGVMGGAETEVDEHTKNIILESACFDMYTIRRTSMDLGVFSDAVTRFTKGQSSRQQAIVAAYAASLFTDLSGAQPASALLDSTSEAAEQPQKSVAVGVEFINTRLGSSLTAEQIKVLLENVEFSVAADLESKTLQVSAPFWRTDIELAEDVVEEVGRLYGFDKLPVELPKHSAKAAQRDELLSLKDTIRQVWASAGANEVLTYSFVHGDLITKAGQDIKEAYHLRNALSPDLQYYRLTLTPSLLAQVHPNIKAASEEFAIFELNKTHVKMHGKTDENVPNELNMVALTYAASDKIAKTKEGAAFYQVRRLLDFLGHKLGMQFRYEPLTEDPPYQVCKPFDWQRSALIYEARTNDFIGQIGEYTAAARHNFKLPVRSAGLEISLEALAKNQRVLDYHVASRFPSTEQDITFECQTNVIFSQLAGALQNAVNRIITKAGYDIEVDPLSSYKPENDQLRRFSFRLTLSHPARTLKTSEVNEAMSEIEKEVGGEVQARRV